MTSKLYFVFLNHLIYYTCHHIIYLLYIFYMFSNSFTIIYACFIICCIHYASEQECTLKELFWGPSSHQKMRSNSVSHTKVDDDSYYLPQSLCDYTEETAKKRINPYKRIVKELLPKKTFKSLYFRCATCLVIAQEINKTVENMTVGETDPKVEIKIIEKALKLLCQNFNINRYKENNVIIKTVPTDSPSSISRSLDNQRLLRLREVCLSYVENVNMPTLYNILLKKNSDTVNYFCRGDGVFRDCFNFNLKTISEEEVNQNNQNDQCVFKILYTL